MARRVTKTTASTERKNNTRSGATEKQKKMSYEITTIVTMTVGVFMGVSFFTSAAGPLGEWVKSFCFWLLGSITSYLIPFAIIGVGIVFIAKKQITSRRYKCIFGFLLLWIISSICGFYELGGGLLGGWIAGPVRQMLGSAGGGIVLFSLMLVLIVVVFEVSITRFCAWLGSGFKYGWELIISAFEQENEDDEGYNKKRKKSKINYEKEIEEIEQDIKNYEKEHKKIDIDMEDVPVKTIDGMPIFQSLRTERPTAEEAERGIETPISTSVKFKLPPLSLLKKPKERNAKAEAKALEETAKKLIETLASFGVEVKIVDYSMGPSVTRYELQPGPGVKISKISNLSDDIALNLAAMGVRIEAPIPGKAAIGIEIPNKNAVTVNIREVIGHRAFESFPSKLAFALGKDIAGEPIIVDIARMPHLLIAGSTGSGKSVCINALITSLLYKALPDEVKLILIDPKMVELGGYNGIPHLLIPVVTNPQKAAGALQWAVKEMTDRYKMFADKGVRDLKSYNAMAKQEELAQVPQIVIIIDELADLMMVAPNDVEDSICRLAQMARAAGMHLVIATQRPSVDVITGIIKANIPSRISFAVSSQIDSRTILDCMGAEKLLGRGDMLYSPIGSNKPVRLQGPYVSDSEVEQVVEFVKKQVIEQEYDQNIIEVVEKFEIGSSTHEPEKPGNADELLPQAIEMAIDCGQASVAMYQRRLKVGYQRAARLIDQMEQRGIIGKFDGTKPRQVLINRAQFNEMFINAEEIVGNG